MRSCVSDIDHWDQQKLLERLTSKVPETGEDNRVVSIGFAHHTVDYTNGSEMALEDTFHRGWAEPWCYGRDLRPGRRCRTGLLADDGGHGLRRIDIDD
jgi:hypothetical protein